jgi:hypothetical protein
MSVIRRSFADRSLTSAQVEAVISAFDATCRELGLADRDDPIVQIVADAVVEVASAAEWDAKAIHRLALQRLTFFDAHRAATTAILSDAIALAGADRGNIQRYNSADRSLAIVVQQGFEKEFLRIFERVSLEDGSACARAMRARIPILVPDVSVDDDFKPYREVAARAGFASVASFPLITASAELIGILSVHFTRTGFPREVTMDRLGGLARHAAAALEGLFPLRS